MENIAGTEVRKRSFIGRVFTTIAVLFMFALIMASMETYSFQIFLVAISALGIVVYSCYRPSWTLLGYRRYGIRILFSLLGVISLILAHNDKMNSDIARNIVKANKLDPNEAARLLMKADDKLLRYVKFFDPELERFERDRRKRVAKVQARVEAERRAEAAKQQEEKNRPRIAAIEKRLAKLGENDYTARISAYKEIIALAPANMTWQRKLAEAESKLADLVQRRSDPERYVNLDNVKWHKGGFGSIMMLTTTIENESLVDLKDFTIRCEHSAPSGTVIDSNERVVYEMVPAGSSKRVRNFNMGFIASQVAATRCEVTEATRA